MKWFALASFAACAGAAGLPVPVSAVAFQPGGKLLATGGYKEVLFWDLDTFKLVKRAAGIRGSVRALAFSKDGRTLAVADGVPARSGAVTLLDTATFEAGAPLEQAKDDMLSLAFSPDGKLLAAGGADSVVRVWSVADRKPVATMKDHTDWVTTVAFSPDGKLLATGSLDKNLLVWETASWKRLVQLPQPLTEAVHGVAFSPEGDLMAFADGGESERAVRLWRTEFAFAGSDSARPNRKNAMRLTRPVDTGTCMPMGVAFLPPPVGAANANARARMLVACTDKTVRVLGPGGNMLATLSGHADWVYAVAAAPDGMKCASASADGTVKIWGAGGKVLATLIAEGTASPPPEAR